MGEQDGCAVVEVLVRYATAIDTRDWDLLRSCFTDDVAADYGASGRWTDREGIVAFMEGAHAGFGPTNHMLTNFTVRIDGDRARARCSVHAVLAFAADPTAWIDTVGHYEDELVRTSDGWRIAVRTFHPTRMVTSDSLP